MKCYVCDAEEKFHSFDTTEKKMNAERELLCCLECGSVCYRVDANQEEKMRDYYRFEYRPSPTHMNMLTTTHKLNYVKCFLADFMKDKKDLIVGDVGCATGYLPNFFRQMGHKATGCEYTITFRRFAENYYGIPITEELRTDLQYDLISIYHVLEHMIEPDKKLAYYAGLLKDGGHMLISTPVWYEALEDTSGPPMQAFKQIWHKDHINCFSLQSIQNLFRKAGLEIVKEDHLVYGQTYLVKKTGKVQPIVKEDPQQRIQQTHAAKEAIELYAVGKFKDAAKLWPKFPEAWIAQITNTFGKDPDRQQDMFEEVTKILPRNRRILTAAMHWHYMYKRYDKVIDIGNVFMQVAPDEEKMKLIAMAYALKGDHRMAMSFFSQTCEMDPRQWQECTDWICAEACQLPAWDERAMEQLHKSIEANTKPKLKVFDPMFDDPAKYRNGKEAETAQPTLEAAKEVVPTA